MNIKKVSILIIVMFIVSWGLNLQLQAKNLTPDQAALININTSDANQLCKIPGIGKKMAGRVISYRQKHGKFRKVAEIMKVKGIGLKRFNKIKKLLTIVLYG